MADPLARLAAAHGVLTEYDDWQDRPVAVPTRTVVAVLACLGVDASTPEAIQRALSLAESTSSRTVDPTVVVTPARRTTSIRCESSPDVHLALDGGQAVTVTDIRPAGSRRFEVVLPDDLPLGYHRLVVRADGAEHEAHLVVAPGRCPGTEHLGRSWGWMAQLYALRSRESWGVGDFTDLATLCRWSGEVAADLVLCNPLHASAPTLPQVDSPYSPSSRRFHHAGYLRASAVPEVDRLDDVAAARFAVLDEAGRRLNSGALLDRDATARLQREALELLYAAGLDADRATSLAAYRQAGGAALEEFATWCALADTYGADWTSWPAAMSDPGSIDVASVRRQSSGLVDFHIWLQWLCDTQLAAAQDAALASGQRIGVIHDLAVGVSPTGADAWALQDVLALTATVGAPPDSFNQRGQSWALPPMHPGRLAETGYAAFREMIRAALRHAGGLRIDHAMGLFRLYWIPLGCPPTEGTYVRYPADDLLAVLALEAELAGAVVIAEDLGTVEDGVPEALAKWGIHGSAVLWFERDDAGRFIPPGAYRPDTFASVTTHDLPTALGFWRGEATRVRAELGLLGEGRSEEDQAALDDEERATLRKLLEREGLATEGSTPEDLAVALQSLVIRSRSRLVGLSLSDAVGDVHQPNLPGTTDAYPNWRLALADGDTPVLLEDLAAHDGVRRITELARRERPRAPRP